MKSFLYSGGALVTLGLLLATGGSAQDRAPIGPPLLEKSTPPAPPLQSEPPVEQAGVEVQTRGPMHEAFAQPSDPKPGPGPTAPRRPPDPIAEEPPPERPEGDDVHWIGGYWYWDAERHEFIWISGVYRKFPPNRRFIPGYWTEENGVWRWVPGMWVPEQQPQLPYDPPPPDSLERGPSLPPPDDESIYVPGCWIYRETRYLWRPGFYIRARPGWVWVSPRYICTPAGWVFIEGYWDYPLEERGLLFAPICFSRPVYLEPAFCYRPRFVVSVSVVLSSLFVCPHRYSYCYGDYYGAVYVRRGYDPWCFYGPRYHDPLFSYYRFQHRHLPSWYADLRQVYTERLEGRLPRPPRNLGQQAALARESALLSPAAPGGKPVVTRSVEVARPLNQVARDRTARLTTAPSSQIKAEVATTQKLREVSQVRRKLERELATTRQQDPTPSRVTVDTQKFQLPVPQRQVTPGTELPGRPKPEGNINKTPAPTEKPRPPAGPGNLPRPENPPPKKLESVPPPTSPVQPPPKNVRPFQAEPPKNVTPPKVESPRIEPPRPAPRQDPPKNVQPFKADPPKQVTPRVEPSKEIPPPKQVTPRVDPPKVQTPPINPPPAPRFNPPTSPPKVDLPRQQPSRPPEIQRSAPAAPKSTPPPAPQLTPPVAPQQAAPSPPRQAAPSPSQRPSTPPARQVQSPPSAIQRSVPVSPAPGPAPSTSKNGDRRR